jgi:asparagine synthase (glutamine-hydrolysing)
MMAGAADLLLSRGVADAALSTRGFTGWVDRHALSAAGGVWRLERVGGGRRYQQTAGEICVGPDCNVADGPLHLVIVRGSPRSDDPAIQRVFQERGCAYAFLSLYERFGPDAIDRMRGRYSICLIDIGKRLVMLGTDRFSVFPVCWASDGSRIAFSGRADDVPLRAPTVISPQALYDYLYFHVIPAPQTIYEKIHRMRTAERLIASDRGVNVGCYWRPNFAKGRSSSFTDLRQRFHAALRCAVARESDEGSVGAYLSGGTDSSTIAGLLREHAGTSVGAYSIGFDADGYDEMAYASLAARHFGLTHRAHYMTSSELVTAVPKIARSLEQPFGNSSIVPAYVCAQLAASDGVAKLLAGDGGDELFGGNSRYAKQLVFEVYWRLPGRARLAIERAMLDRSWSQLPVLRKIRSYVTQARTEMPARAEAYNLLTRLGPANLLSEGFLRRVDTAKPAFDQALTWAHTKDHEHLVNRMLAYDWQYTLADSDLPKVTISSALANVAVGFPMLDDDLLDLSLELPPTLKVRGTTLRPFFKQALRDFLPAAVIRKRKHGFGMPFGVWLARDKRLSEYVGDRIDGVSARGIFRAGALQRLRSVHMTEHAGYYGEMIWVAVMLEEWLRVSAPDLHFGD